MLDDKKYPTKRYLHFDHRVNIRKVENYVTDPQKIAKHSFLPLIHYVSSFEKYTGEPNPDLSNRPTKEKRRDIMYAGHLDSHIYKYYAEILNSYHYNSICEQEHIDDCITAYRNNKRGQSNIDFAAFIINETVQYGAAYILIGDFTNYFDKINHQILKENLKKVLDVSFLDKDWYNIYRSITKHGYYEKIFLEKEIGTDSFFKSEKKRSYFDSIDDFRKFQRKNKSEYNTHEYGIPQGTAISAVFANIYALSFDIKMKEIAVQNGGIYRRYSDDFILVIPKKELSEDCFRQVERNVRSLAEKNEIIIQEDKTGLFSFENGEIINIETSLKDSIDYLGFIFDGKTVSMRGKSPAKFYRKANDLIYLATKVKKKKNLKKLPYRKKIYSLYTDMGGVSRGYHSFIDYAYSAQKKINKISPYTHNIMMNQIKNRKKKIEIQMKVKIHTRV